jgi:hypothetical protein
VTGKTIRIFLAEGEPTGILPAEISNWTGEVLAAPRSQVDQLSQRDEVRRTGVCLFVGPDPDDPSRALASIGEGDNVLGAAAPPELERGQGLLGAHRRHDSTTRIYHAVGDGVTLTLVSPSHPQSSWSAG